MEVIPWETSQRKYVTSLKKQTKNQINQLQMPTKLQIILIGLRISLVIPVDNLESFLIAREWLPPRRLLLRRSLFQQPISIKLKHMIILCIVFQVLLLSKAQESIHTWKLKPTPAKYHTPKILCTVLTLLRIKRELSSGQERITIQLITTTAKHNLGLCL